MENFETRIHMTNDVNDFYCLARTKIIIKKEEGVNAKKTSEYFDKHIKNTPIK